MPVATKAQPHITTAMEVAMRDAGIETAVEQGERNARDLAKKAWDLYPNDAKARRRYLASQFMPQGIYWVMQKTNPTDLVYGMGWLLNLVGPEQDARQAVAEGAKAPGPIVTQTSDRGRPGAETFQHGQLKRSETVAANIFELNRVAAARAKSKLDFVMVQGRPLRYTIVAEARLWADQCERDAQTLVIEAIFIRNLCANLPGHQVLGDHWTDADEVERIYERAATVHEGAR